MAGKDVDISFNFTMDAEEAMELLTMIREKHHFHENTELTESPTWQIAQQREKVETFKQIPISTLKKGLALLSNQYKSQVFSYAEARRLLESRGVSRTIVGYALRYGCLQKEVFKVGYGNYSFKATADYQADSNSQVDIVAKDSAGLVSAVRLMSKVSDTVSLYFSNSAVVARFRNHDSSAMIDVRIRRYAFDVMHVKGHVKLTFSCKQLAAILAKKGKAGPVHLLLVNQKDSTFKAGFLGDEHILPVLACEISEEAYGAELPIDTASPDSIARIELPRLLFEDIVANVKAHCDEMLIACRNDGTVSFESFETAGYRKELTRNRSDVKIDSSSGGVRACFPLSTITALVDMQASKDDDSIKLDVRKGVLIVSLVHNKDFQVDYYVAPCRVEEVKAKAPAVTREDFHSLATNISRLEKEMGIDKSKKG
jgi:hypothetical protein